MDSDIALNSRRLDRVDSIVLRDAESELNGTILLPESPTASILIASAGEAQKYSSLFTRLSEHLASNGFACFIVDLLGDRESSPELVENLAFLKRRLSLAHQWIEGELRTTNLPLGVFATGTAAAAALKLSRQASWADSVVSCNGRPDLAAPRLYKVRVPVMLLVNSRNRELLRLNRATQRVLPNSRLEILSGDTHVFEMAPVVEKISKLSSLWFSRHLAESARKRRQAA